MRNVCENSLWAKNSEGDQSANTMSHCVSTGVEPTLAGSMILWFNMWALVLLYDPKLLNLYATNEQRSRATCSQFCVEFVVYFQ